MVELEENGCPQFDGQGTETAGEDNLESFCESIYNATQRGIFYRDRIVLTLIGKEYPRKAQDVAKLAEKLLTIFEKLMKKYQRYVTVNLIVGNNSWYQSIKALRYIRLPVIYYPRVNISATGLSLRLAQLLDTHGVIAMPGGRMTSIERNMALEAGLPVFDIK